MIGGAVYICSFLIACRHGKNRKAMHRALAVISAVVLVLFVLLQREIIAALSDYLERGFSDNGRFELWRHGMLAFLENPLLGKGIFGLQRELDSGTAEGFTFYGPEGWGLINTAYNADSKVYGARVGARGKT